jgi:hypothetical protein
LQGQRTMMDQYFKWHPPDQRLRHHAVEHQQHRKQDLKPDWQFAACLPKAVSGSTLHVG